ncbi:MAG: PQQ-binding-like beta-propeller repeat protein [Bacteroidales bacterium]|nr:PQQ-binding-like beta-propeller repeat protein [Bacteroidales bacterium]
MKIKLLIIVMFLIGTFANAQEPTAWRNGTGGIYNETGLLDEWPEDGPEIIWSYEALGQGHSSVAISGGNIYTSGMIDETGYLFKFTKGGELVYKKAYGPEFSKSWYGTRGTPVVVGDRVYLVSGHGKLTCFNDKNGEKVWEIDMVYNLGGEVLSWGYNETPVVDGDIIYATPGGKKHNFAAFNRHTGEMIWSSTGKGELTAYCTPLLFVHNGRKILATHSESFLMGFDAETGEMLWSHKHPNKFSVHANTPIYHDGGLFFFSGYGQGAGKLELSDDGSAIEHVWSNPLDSRMGGAVLIDGYIYGSGDYARDMRCVDWKTGEDMYTSQEIGKGVVIAADGKLYCYSDRGELALVNVTPEKFDLVSETRVTKGSEQHWAHPVIHEGILYLRHGQALIAYRIK